MSHISGLIGKLFYYYPDKLINKLGHMYYQSQIKGKTDTLHLKGRMRIQRPNRLVVGDNCCINDGCLMQCQGGNAGKQRYNLNRRNSIGTSVQNDRLVRAMS